MPNRNERSFLVSLATLLYGQRFTSRVYGLSTIGRPESLGRACDLFCCSLLKVAGARGMWEGDMIIAERS